MHLIPMFRFYVNHEIVPLREGIVDILTRFNTIESTELLKLFADDPRFSIRSKANRALLTLSKYEMAS